VDGFGDDVRTAELVVCKTNREFGISRKTGYKIFDRYQECGIQGLTDRSRRPLENPFGPKVLPM